MIARTDEIGPGRDRSSGGVSTTIHTATVKQADQLASEALDLLGPTLELLIPPGAGDDAPSLMRGTIPPGVSVPLHSHGDPETFVAVSGEVDGLVESADGFTWQPIRPGDVFIVPSGAKHGFRNRGDAPAVSIAMSTSKLARFFLEVGEPVVPGTPPSPPTPERLERFLAVAERYGYWNATPEENAQVGIVVPALSGS
jgi:quercetin dioxygenase-like cupin family protein